MDPKEVFISTLDTIARNHQKVSDAGCPNALGFESGIGTAKGWARDFDKQSDFQWQMNELVEEQGKKLNDEDDDMDQKERMCRRGLRSAFMIAADLSLQLWPS